MRKIKSTLPPRSYFAQGRLRRRTIDGACLHCCCICGTLGRWTSNWSWFGSIAEEEQGMAIPKFCSSACAEAAGPGAQNVTSEMLARAVEAEYRDPDPAPKSPRSYADALYEQRRALKEKQDEPHT